MKKTICIFSMLILLMINHVYGQDYGTSQGLPRSEIDIALEDIKGKNVEALKAIDTSLQLLKSATESAISKPEIDKLFNNLLQEINKSLGGIDDQSELMKYVGRLTQNIREKIERYNGHDEDQRHWVQFDKKLKEKVKEIYHARENIGQLLGEVLEVKYDIYKKLELSRVRIAIGSLDKLTGKLEFLRQSLSKIKDIPYDLSSSAPAN